MSTMVAGHWLAVRDGDPRARALFVRHYSATLKRTQPQAPIGNAERFAGPGEHMVLLTEDCGALYVWRAERFRLDGQRGVGCSIVRNESPVLSSELIREACELAWQRWPGERLFTYVADAKIRSTNPGACFKAAGWRRCGRNADGRLTILELLPSSLIPPTAERSGTDHTIFMPAPEQSGRHYTERHSPMAPPVVITEAPAEVVVQADHILESHHEHLLTARILWLFTDAKMTRGGKVLAGKGKKLSPEMRFLSSGLESVEAGYDFVITVSSLQWHSLLATQRTALLDHLLCFCDRKERINSKTGAVSYSWAVRGPDVEEFTQIIARHGLWRPSIKRFAEAMPKQLELPADETIEAKLPVSRTTTVDGTGIVVKSELEGDAPIGRVRLYPVESQSEAAEPTREALIDDLDARDVALDAAASPSERAGMASVVSHDSQGISDENAQKADSEAISGQMPESWQKRVGLGRALWGRAAQP